MNFRLAAEHYTVVDDKNIEVAQRHLSSCYWYKTKPSSPWKMLCNLPLFMKSNGIEVPASARDSTLSSCSSTSLRTAGIPRSSSYYPTCSTASFEEQWIAIQQSLAGGWLRRSSLCSSSSLLHYGGAGGKLRVTNVLRFDVPGHTQQFSGVRFQTAYVTADRIDDDRVEKHFAKQGNAPSPYLVLFPLCPCTHWWMVDKYNDLGWLEGNFDTAFLDNMHNLFDLAIRHPQLDPKKVFVFGFSAGGYALTEMIASNRGLKARALVLGGIHGHGNTVEEAKKFPGAARQGQLALESYEQKWDEYMERMRRRPMRHVPKIVAVHNVLDTLSPWGPAQLIIDALDATRMFDAVPGIQRVLLDKPASAREAFTAQEETQVIGPDATLPTPPPSSLATISSSSTHPPSSLKTGAATSSSLPLNPPATQGTWSSAYLKKQAQAYADQGIPASTHPA
eukprot:909388-Amphidinium_carterae.1